MYDVHLQDGVLAICDGFRSCSALKDIAQCTIKDINTVTEEEKAFYHLNTVYNFHSFIKEQYVFYRGIATKYLNRYNALFTVEWQQKGSAVASVSAESPVLPKIPPAG